MTGGDYLERDDDDDDDDDDGSPINCYHLEVDVRLILKEVLVSRKSKDGFRNSENILGS